MRLLGNFIPYTVSAAEVGMQNGESGHRTHQFINTCKKINMVYGFPMLRCTEAVWDKFITEESKSISEISEGTPTYVAKPYSPATSVPET